MEGYLDFETAGVDDLVSGCILRDGEYRCVVCGAAFPKGEIFPQDGRFFDAETAAARHIQEAHGSMLDYLLHLRPEQLGLSEVQLELLRLLAAGRSDKEAAAQKGVAPSTIRNHRFKLREKEKQARRFLAIMKLLGRRRPVPTEEAFCHPHRSATAVDARYAVTEGERRDILAACFDENGALRQFPAREKRKLVVLAALAEQFRPGRQYTEQEVDRLLGRIYEDYPYLRRLLIEYGFLERTASGSAYWRKE